LLLQYDKDIFRFFVFLSVRLYLTTESFEIYSVKSLHHVEFRTVKKISVALNFFKIKWICFLLSKLRNSASSLYSASLAGWGAASRREEARNSRGRLCTVIISMCIQCYCLVRSRPLLFQITDSTWRGALDCVSFFFYSSLPTPAIPGRPVLACTPGRLINLE